MNINCDYYDNEEKKCIIGDCYISKMPKETPQEILSEHVQNCISRKVIIEKYLNNFPRNLEKNLNKNL